MQNLDENKLYEGLYEFFASVKSAEDMRLVLDDLCTFNEIEQMAQRLECAKLILSGKTYNQITESLDVSSATLSRVSRCVRHGSGGYGKVYKDYLSSEEE